jgi:hypothetical protein
VQRLQGHDHLNESSWLATILQDLLEGVCVDLGHDGGTGSTRVAVVDDDSSLAPPG